MAGAYPMVGKLLPPCKNARSTVVETASGAKVRLHPSSANYNLSLNKSSGYPLVIYDEITRGDGGSMSIKKCSVVGSYPLLLLASEMAVAPPDGDNDEEEGSSGDEVIMSSPDNTVSVVVDRWLRFHATALDVAQMYCLRERLVSAILFKVRIIYHVTAFSILICCQCAIIFSILHLMKACFLQVQHPQDVLPPALGATMYAIACILTYDGLPAMVQCNTGAFDSRPAERRGGGYIRPNDFLTSLLTDRVAPLAEYLSPENILPPSDGGRDSLPSKTVPGPSAPQSSKRQRDSARRRRPQ
jgi:hypothetical protein